MAKRRKSQAIASASQLGTLEDPPSGGQARADVRMVQPVANDSCLRDKSSAEAGDGLSSEVLAENCLPVRLFIQASRGNPGLLAAPFQWRAMARHW